MTHIPDVEIHLKRLILTVKLAPGEILTERWAASFFNTSLYLVRTAFRALASEGLLKRHGKNWIITRINAKEIEQLYIYREALEISALKISANKITDLNLRMLEDILNFDCYPDPENIINGIGTQFHLQLAALSGNIFITDGVRHSLLRLSRARLLDSTPVNNAWDDHRKIVTALRNKDIEKASKLLAQHLQKSRERLIDAII